MLAFISILAAAGTLWTDEGVPRPPAPGVIDLSDGWEMRAPRHTHWKPVRLPVRRLWRKLVTGPGRCWKKRHLPAVWLRRTVDVPAALAQKGAALHLGAFAGGVRVWVGETEIPQPKLAWYVVVGGEHLRPGRNEVRLEVKFACWSGGLKTRGVPRLGPLAPRPRGGFLATFRSRQDGTTQPYSVYLPTRWSPESPAPLVVGLHGQNGDPTSFVYMKLLDELEQRGWVGVFPYARGSSLYLREGEVDVLEAIEEVKGRIAIDPRRVYVVGFSMGGTGSLTMALRHPHLFAAAAAYQADARFDAEFDRGHRAFIKRKRWFGGDLAMAKRYSPEELLPNALHVPIFLCQGTADTISPVRHTLRLRSLARRVRGGGRVGRRLEVALLPGFDHEEEVLHRTIERAFRLFDATVAPAPPERVVYRADDPTVARSYWMTVAPKLGRWAQADVSVDHAGNRITVHSARGTESVEIDAAAAGLDEARPIEVQNQSRTPVRVKVGARIVSVDARRTRALGPVTN
jgi:dienelactone hydrolase